MSGKMYQVQNGQKVDITPQVATLSTGTRRNVGELVYSLVPLDDAGLHLLDGSLIATTGVYAEGVAAIIALRPNHPYLFTSETMWQQSVNQYGVCGKFVYDAGAGTLRLPKITGFVEGTLDATAIGDLIEAGLPNINAAIQPSSASPFELFSTDVMNVEGAFAVGAGPSLTLATTGTTQNNIVRLDFNAQRANAIYGNSTTVQPQAIKGYLYMVLANRPKTPIQVDIDNIAADLALKADVSLGNVNSTGQAAMAHAAMPSGQHIELSVPASGTNITAPADGWMCLYGAPVAGSIAGILLSTSVALQTRANTTETDGNTLVCYVPVGYGGTVEIGYYNIQIGHSQTGLRFIYANGSAPQP